MNKKRSNIINSRLLKEAGHALMSIIWVENFAKALSHLKLNTICLNKLKSKDTRNYSVSLWQLNQGQSFEKTVHKFKKAFPSYTEANKLLEDLWLIRDVLSHSQILPGGNGFFCNLKKDSRKKHSSSIKRMKKPLKDGEALQILIDDNYFDETLKDCHKFDSEIFPKICNELKIPYIGIAYLDFDESPKGTSPK